MMKIWRKDFKGQGGYSLMEILIVGMIVSALASIAFINYQMVVEKSCAKEGDHMLLALLASQKRYLVEYGSFTSDINKLDGFTVSSNFDISGVYAPAGNVGVVATVRRRIAYPYSLSIDNAGVITCFDATGPHPLCTQLGYTPG